MMPRQSIRFFCVLAALIAARSSAVAAPAHDLFLCATVSRNYVIGSKLVTDSGLVACRDAKSGEKIWESERILRDCSASPILWDGKLFVLDEFGTCAILAAGRRPRTVFEPSSNPERRMTRLTALPRPAWARLRRCPRCRQRR